MTSFDKVRLREVAPQERLSAALQDSYQRRAIWSQTSTARWLNDRADAVNSAALRLGWFPAQRCDGAHHKIPKQPGYVLKLNASGPFARIHGRLAALPSDEAREAALVPDIVC